MHYCMFILYIHTHQYDATATFSNNVINTCAMIGVRE